jgi:phage terminase small subunit
MSRKLGSHLDSTKPKGKPVAGEPVKPAHLSASASAEWDRILGELISSGLTLTPAHRGLVALAATLSADIRKCWTVLQENGGDYTTAGTGAVKLHPAAARLDCLRRDLAKVLASLGLQKPAQEDPDDGKPTLEDVLDGDGTAGSAARLREARLHPGK